MQLMLSHQLGDILPQYKSSGFLPPQQTSFASRPSTFMLHCWPHTTYYQQFVSFLGINGARQGEEKLYRSRHLTQIKGGLITVVNIVCNCTRHCLNSTGNNNLLTHWKSSYSLSYIPFHYINIIRREQKIFIIECIL